MDNNSFDYDIFIHTNKISGAYHNRWSNEHTDNYKNENIIKILIILLYEYKRQFKCFKEPYIKGHYSLDRTRKKLH